MYLIRFIISGKVYNCSVLAKVSRQCVFGKVFKVSHQYESRKVYNC